MATQNGNGNEYARASEVLREAMKRMQTLKIDGTAAFEVTVTTVADWALQQEGGEQVLLNIAAYMQRRAIEREVLARMARIPAHSAN